MTTPEDHDREAAVVQGLTHLIAKVLLGMGPLPTRMTTESFDLLSEAISMVQDDAPEVFEAIEKANPYAETVRRQFLTWPRDLVSIRKQHREYRCTMRPDIDGAAPNGSKVPRCSRC